MKIPITIIVADDHPVVLEGLRNILTKDTEFEIVATANDGKTALALCEKYQPHLILLDIAMPRLNGLEVTVQVRQKCPFTKVVIISMYTEREYVHRIFQAGSSGYISKTENLEKLPEILKRVLTGHVYLSQEITNVLVHLMRLPAHETPAAPLTKREREILQWLVDGASTATIAHELNVSRTTVERHRANIMHKLNVHDKASLIRYALQNKLVVASMPHHAPPSENDPSEPPLPE